MKLVVWDFDGTLADSFGSIRAAVDRAFSEHGLPALEDAALRSVIGLNLATMFGRLVAPAKGDADPALVAGLVAAYRSSWSAESGELPALFPGMTELLADLQKRGVLQAVATSKGAGARRLVGRLGLAETFATVVTNDDVAEPKPHPEMVLKACELVGVPPDHTVVVGDTVFDIEMGQQAGAQTIGVTWGNQSSDQLAAVAPTLLVHTVAELRAALSANERFCG